MLASNWFQYFSDFRRNLRPRGGPCGHHFQEDLTCVVDVIFLWSLGPVWARVGGKGLGALSFFEVGKIL